MSKDLDNDVLLSLLQIRSENQALKHLVLRLISHLSKVDSGLPGSLAKAIQELSENIPTAPDGVIVLHLQKQLFNEALRGALNRLLKDINSL